jgi:hypothetical protein
MSAEHQHHHTVHELRVRLRASTLARHVLVAFVLTFIVSRAVVLLQDAGWLPPYHLQLGATHVHHLNFGIFLLAGIAAYLLFARPEGRAHRLAASVYGVALGLTFDEFGMWLHLEDIYWQRASFDAVVLIAAILGLIATAPTLRRVRPRHWATAVGLAVAIILFGVLILKPLWSAGRDFGVGP